MPVYTNKRTGRLFVQFDYLGHTYKRTLPKGAKRSDASKLETKMRADLFFEANGVSQKRGVLFEEFVVDTYLPSILESQGKDAHDRADQLLTSVLPFLRGKELRAIKADDIDRIQRFRTNLKYKRGETYHDRAPSTVHREMAILGKMFSDAVNNDLIDYNPCSRVKKPRFDNMQDRVLQYGDDEKFFAAFDPQQGMVAHDVCLLVLNTGLSQKDVLNLDPFKITLRDRKLVITRSKTKRRVEIPLNDIAYQICKERMKGGPLFISNKTGKAQTSVKTAMAGACRRADIEKLTIRDLRRTFATRLYESGADVLTIAELLGHAGLRMVMRYVRTLEKRRKAVENMRNPATVLPSISEQGGK